VAETPVRVTEAVPVTVTVPAVAVAETPVRVTEALAATATMPAVAVAETPVRVTRALAETTTVPAVAVADTPVTVTATDSVPGKANGALAKGEKPNMGYFRLLSPSALEVYHFLRC
jgi:hypothetical protein